MLANISLSSVANFLSRKGWEIDKVTDRFQKLSGPDEIGNAVKITLPVSDRNEYDKALLNKVADLIAEIYDYSEDEISAVLNQEVAIFSAQLIDSSTDNGAIPFLKFEHHIQEIKNLLLNNASFSVSKKHYVNEVPEEANTYLNLCNFLQTKKGSFISRVQLPTAVDLSVNLFSEFAVQSRVINDNLGDILKFVVNDIYKSSASEIYSVGHVTENASLININVFENVNNLFKRTEVREINFSLVDAENDLRIESGPVGSEEFKQLENYIDLASAVFSNHIEVDSRGRIVQLRSSSAKGSNNLAVISRLQRGLKPIHVSLSDAQYDLAISAHKLRSTVVIKGTAVETKQYLRIIRIVDFSVI